MKIADNDEISHPNGTRGNRMLSRGERNVFAICLCLKDGPQTLEEIRANIESNSMVFARRLGFVTRLGNLRKRERRMLLHLPAELDAMVGFGWVEKEGDRYRLTELGQAQTNLMADKARKFVDTLTGTIRVLQQPRQAAKIILIVQVTLAALKLPAGLISGSVGLLNDSIDTLMDLFSSLLVYLGLRFNKDSLVSVALASFMLITGAFTLYQAVHRLLVPYVPEVHWFPFATAIVSAISGLILWTYQRYIGIHSKSMAFIAQSVDARNHVIVAISVTLGLVAALMNFGLIDMLVGLAVACLILWSAARLFWDLKKSSGKRPDFSRYGLWLEDAFDHFRERQLGAWMLDLVQNNEVLTRAELLDRAKTALDFHDNRWLQVVGLNEQMPDEHLAERSLQELISRGWLVENEQFSVTEEGKNFLRRRSAKVP